MVSTAARPRCLSGRSAPGWPAPPAALLAPMHGRTGWNSGRYALARPKRQLGGCVHSGSGGGGGLGRGRRRSPRPRPRTTTGSRRRGQLGHNAPFSHLLSMLALKATRCSLHHLKLSVDPFQAASEHRSGPRRRSSQNCQIPVHADPHHRHGGTRRRR